MGNMREIQDKFAGTFGVDDGGDTAAHALFDIDKVTHFDGYVDTTSVIKYNWKNDTGYSVKISSIQLIPSGALTAHAVNYATVTVHVGTAGDLASAGAVSTTSGGTGNWVLDTPETITVTDANATVADGDIVKITLSYNFDGVSNPAFDVIVKYVRV